MKTIFEMCDLTNTVSIQLEKSGRKTEKVISMDDFIESVMASRNKSDFVAIESPLFKEVNGIKLIQSKQIGKNSFIYIIQKTRSIMPMVIYSRMYPDCGMPNLLYGIKIVNNKLSQMFLVTVKDDVITEESKIFKYPFTNVSGDTGRVCLGGNSFEVGILEGDSIYNVPLQFFSMPNTMDSFSVMNNTKGFEFEEMVKELSGKEFDDNLLVENEKITTYKEWFKAI